MAAIAGRSHIAAVWSSASTQHCSSTNFALDVRFKPSPFSLSQPDPLLHQIRLRTKHEHMQAVLAIMSIDTAFPVRPFAGGTSSIDNDLDSAFRVHINQAVRPLGLANGDLIRLRTSSGFKGYATAWQALQLQKSPHVNVHEVLRKRYGLAFKDQVFIEKAVDSRKPLKLVVVRPSSATAEHLDKFSSTEEFSFWIRCALGKVSQSISGVWHACSNTT
jgi:hypothetical protein